jgi:uracil-DNA glycosylase
MNNSLSLLDEILQFLNNEREMYGDFSVHRSKSKKADSLRIHELADTLQNIAQSVSHTEKKTADNSNEDKKENFMNKSLSNSGTMSLREKLSACNTLDELYKICLDSDELKTDLENTNMVFGTGNPNADLMIIGEAPGEQEDKEGEPFVGRAGQLLTKILGAIKFKRSDVYITNILKHRPPDNRDPLPEERERSLSCLYRQIEIISPKLILCLGKVAATTLLDRDEYLRDLRGKFHSFRGSLLMVTYHPAALLRNQSWKRPVWEDVQLLREKYDELGCSTE